MRSSSLPGLPRVSVMRAGYREATVFRRKEFVMCCANQISQTLHLPLVGLGRTLKFMFVFFLEISMLLFLLSLGSPACLDDNLCQGCTHWQYLMKVNVTWCERGEVSSMSSTTHLEESRRRRFVRHTMGDANVWDVTLTLNRDHDGS